MKSLDSIMNEARAYPMVGHKVNIYGCAGVVRKAYPLSTGSATFFDVEHYCGLITRKEYWVWKFNPDNVDCRRCCQYLASPEYLADLVESGE